MSDEVLSPPPKIGTSDRPKTSATEVHLRTNRQKALTALKLSREQERLYVTRKQAGFGKQEAEKAKIHLQSAQKNFCAGLTCTWHAATNLPAILKEKRDSQRQQRIKKKKEREEEVLKNLEELTARKPVENPEEQAEAAAD
ncbi:hypothetical protein GcM3_021011 [Golovinomyces cichoracearum]|uniref:Uncharacterized protein n=1 Tax=Golovinomyces cichoracearum TaxID=62708 RepID=A0A420J7J8_9PEZI|nr:hypothetical protein GcM3_021011 [Golovinomyces cichoracearum]